MKKIVVCFLVLIFVCSFVACSQQPSSGNAEQLATEVSGENADTSEPQLPTTVVYKVEAMQNINYCTYYTKGQTPPSFSGDPTRFWEKIYIATQCGNCGKQNISTRLIDPSELDFSNGDTIIYSDSDQCYDCYWDKDIQQFMWSIRVSRTTARVCTQCEQIEPSVNFSSNTPTCDECNNNSITKPKNDLPITVAFADESLLNSGNYHHCCVDTSEYMVQIAFQANEILRDVSFTYLDVSGDSFRVIEEFYSVAEMNPDKPLVADVSFPGIASVYGISFTTSDGTVYTYAVSTSGKDGSLVFSEYIP